MELFLIRHGESENNVNLSKSEDSPLSPFGVQQVNLTADYLRQFNIQRIYTSPLLRALQTGNIIAQKLDIDLEVVVELSERGMCQAENGLSRESIISLFPGVILPEKIDQLGWARHWVGETWRQMIDRTKQTAVCIKDLEEQQKYERIACIIHHTSGSMIIRHLLSIPKEPAVFLRHANCGITQIVFEGNKTIMVRLNDTHHLRE